jgi:prophage antirepressor-like protein
VTAALELFTYADQPVRVVIVDGEPWFVLADLCKVLAIANPSNVAARLDQDGINTLRLAEGIRGNPNVTVVNEPNMYEVVIRSDKPEAVAFRRWITGEVLPAIRKTGGYSTAPALTEDEIVHQALAITARRVEELTERVAELEPKAEVADRILNAEGDLSVRDTAQALTRAGVKVGQNRLFAALEKHYRWISRSPGDGRYRVKQAAIEAGYMSVIPQSHYHPKTGVLVLDPPQPRVTPKGLQRILTDHGAEKLAAERAEASA